MPVLFLSVLLASPAWAASVKVESAWIREPAPGQTVVGGFMDLTSDQDASLIQASSPVAGLVELHEMKMQGDVMQMRPVTKIDLPKNKTIKLQPGGLHLMLEKLKKPIKAGDKVPLTLKIKSGGKVETVKLAAEVRFMTAPAAMRAPAKAEAGTPAPAATAAGEKIYNSACVACHASGAAGAPKLGDKAAWAARIKGGMDALYASSLKGKGAMPPKGGRMALSDADVKAATDYMVARSQ
jgi:copper(I)-binding protein